MKKRKSRFDPSLPGSFSIPDANAIASIMLELGQTPQDTRHCWYHYTDWDGFEGILRSGGLRAMHRVSMGDKEEFEFAYRIIKKVLEWIACNESIKSIRDFAVYANKNLERLVNPNDKFSSFNYCACLTIHHDDKGHWKEFGDNGKGFAIGFWVYDLIALDFMQFSDSNSSIRIRAVEYSAEKVSIVIRNALVEANCQLFNHIKSNGLDSIRHARLRNEFIKLLSFWFYFMMHFIKRPDVAKEREIRLMFHPSNDSGTLNDNELKYLQDGTPYIFFDLKNRYGLMPIGDIVFGPNAFLPRDLDRVEYLLDELGYSAREMIRRMPENPLASINHRVRPNTRFSELDSWL